ncbi:MAG: cytochrome c [Gemmatimonadales bacterium]|nr:MAG: cytochrome c [Gemmatimonadales bacterium]
MLRAAFTSTLVLSGVTSFGLFGSSGSDLVPTAVDSEPDGKMLYELVCAMCHTMEPPPSLAPPISHAAAYYFHRFDSEDEAVAAMVAFLREPTEEASLLPARAIERFGLMPSQGHLSHEQLEAVARYSLTLADTTHGRGMSMEHDHPHQ